MQLTIVVPFFKRMFLTDALESLAAQTCQNFSVFIGDDFSPEDARDIVERFRGRLAVTYHRFAENLGRASVVAHWNRCVSMTGTEWVWLFSDDDVASPDCVAAFYREIEAADHPLEVYRFDSSIVDADGAFLRNSPPNPAQESAAELALCRLIGWREFFIQNHIFSRCAFDREGGFVDLPTGLFSEDASYTRFAKRTGVRTIPEGRVFWRQSEINLNAARPELVDSKLVAYMRHLFLLRTFFKGEKREFHRKLRGGGATWISRAAPALGGSPSRWARWRFYAQFGIFAPTRLWAVARATTAVWKRQRRESLRDRAVPRVSFVR
jgi:glycosyltransferase involved in cell wall biosynthesis